MLHIWLDGRVFEFSANETLGIENSVWWVHGDLVLGSVTNQTFRVSESNIGRSSTVTLNTLFRDDYLEVSIVFLDMNYHSVITQPRELSWLSSKKSDNFEGVFVIIVIPYVSLCNIVSTNLVIGDDFDFSVLEDAYAWVGCTKINTDSCSFSGHVSFCDLDSTLKIKIINKWINRAVGLFQHDPKCRILGIQ